MPVTKKKSTTRKAPIFPFERQAMYELENTKLYLFDILERLSEIERKLDRLIPVSAPLIPELDRNAMYKGPNASKGQDFVRRNVAQILKNMLPQATLDMMPKEVREAYHNILSVMGAPNDPVWEKEPKPDPRDPDTFKNVSDLWNNVANNMKKLEGVNLSEEIAKAATEVFNVDSQTFQKKDMDEFMKNVYGEKGTRKEEPGTAAEPKKKEEEPESDQ